ncbi:MAG: hypothetical protein QXD13_02140 [Candidatus Pacearchaeota archaeon]
MRLKKIGKKGKFGDTLMNNLTYMIVLIVFFAGMMLFIQTKMNGAGVWEDFYAKEIAKVINAAKPGDYVTLDVRSATKIAAKNKIGFEEIFSFDNDKSDVCVKLSAGGRSCYSYFNQVNIESEGVKLLEPVNVLKFRVEAKT